MQLPAFFQNLKTRLLEGPLRPGGFIRNVTTILVGNALAQIIAIVVIPVLALIFSPADFGALATFTAITTILLVASSFCYHAAIVLPKRDESAFTLLIVCLLIGLMISSLTGLCIWLYKDTLLEWTNHSMSDASLWLIPFGVLGLGWFQALQMWTVRKKHFATNSKGVVVSKLAVSGAQLSAGGISVSGFGLIAGQVLGQALGVIYLITKSLPLIPGFFWKHVTRKNVIILLHRYRQFPAYNMFASLSSTVARNLPVILLSYFFTAATVGFFSIAFRLLAAPLQLIGAAVTEVFFQRANDEKQSAKLAEITLKAYDRLVALFLTPLTLVALAAPEIILLLFGDEWADTAVYLRWLALWTLFTSIAAPLHRLFAIVERQNEQAIIDGMLFVVSAVSPHRRRIAGRPVYSDCTLLRVLGSGLGRQRHAHTGACRRTLIELPENTRAGIYQDAALRGRTGRCTVPDQRTVASTRCYRCMFRGIRAAPGTLPDGLN